MDREGHCQIPRDQNCAGAGSKRECCVPFWFSTATNCQEGFMLDLVSLTGDFIQNEFQKFNRDNSQDEATLRAVGTANMERADREQQVRKWLNGMRVIRFFPSETDGKIVRQILKYANGPPPSGPLRSKAAIVSEYERLKQRIQAIVGHSQKSGKPRDVTSVTSKALWCCYPDDVPIFDADAHGALRVIARLCQIVLEPNLSPYGLFVDVWLQLYEKVKPVIDQADLKGYPYKIRVLDKLLWHLRSPGFEKSGVDVPQSRPTRKVPD